MNYAELLEEINEMPVAERKVMKRLAQAVGSGSDINSRYECVLDTTNSCQEFFDAIYTNPELALDKAWADIARALHPDWFDRFQPKEVERGIPLTNGCVVLEGLEEQAPISIPIADGSETADVYYFDDGQFNEYTLRIEGVYNGAYRVGKIQTSDQFSVGTYGNRVVIIGWILDEEGFRISMESKFRICCSLIINMSDRPDKES